MTKINKNNHGFVAVEFLLVIIVLALMGFIGWFVYHNDHKTGLSASVAAAQISSFTINQWEIQAPYNGDLTLEYNVIDSDNTQFAYLSSAQLDNTDPACQSAGYYGGAIARYASTAIIPNEDGTSSNETAEQYFTGNLSAVYKKIGNYYYWYQGPKSTCGTSTISKTYQVQTVNAFKDLIPALEVVPSD